MAVGCVVAASFQNLEVLAQVAGPRSAADLRQVAETELSNLGSITVTDGGLGFACVVAGDFDDVIDELRRVSWVAHSMVGVTEAWRFRANGVWLQGRFPRRLLECSAGLRFGVTALGGNPAAAYTEARDSVLAQKSGNGVTRLGFAPLWPKALRTLTQIADRECPACAAGSPSRLLRGPDLDIEQCDACGLEFERHRVWLVGGRHVGACAHLVARD